MKLVLHIGFHKTGTSAIQAFCRENRDTLAAQGLLYPQSGLVDLEFTSTPTSVAGHRGIKDVLVSPLNQNSEKRLNEVIAEARGYEDIHTVLISSETFSAPRTKISPSVLDSLKRYFSDIRVLVYLRRQDEWASSLYKEIICWPGRRFARSFKRSLTDFLPEWLDYEERLNKWVEIFGAENVSVKSYDDRENKNIVVEFFNELGVDIDDSERFRFPGFSNPTLPDHLVPLMRWVNRRKLNREQRSQITNHIFNQLEVSEHTVANRPILTPRLMNSMARRYEPVNRKLAEKFGIEPFRNFCAFEARSRPDRVKSLTPAQIRQVKTRVTEILRENRRKNQPIKGRENQGRAGLSCLLNEDPLQVKVFVNYHLALGFSRIRLYFDNPEDPMASYDFGTDKVEVIRCTADFWQRQIGRNPENNAEKLSVCHKHGLNDLNRREDIDWVINLDADELLYVKPGTTLAEYLASVANFRMQIRVRPLEAVFVSDDDSQLFSARYFKVPRIKMREKRIPRGKKLIAKCFQAAQFLAENISDSRLVRFLLLSFSRTACIFLVWSRSDQKLYEKHMPELSRVMREGFLAHRLGRVFTRHGLQLDDVTSHEPEFGGRRSMMLRTNNTVFLLHYDAADFSAWYLKWHRRIYGGSTVAAIHDKRRLQQDLFREAVESGEPAIRALFEGFFVFPEDSLDEFQRAGLLVQLDSPLVAQVKQDLAAAEDRAQIAESKSIPA